MLNLEVKKQKHVLCYVLKQKGWKCKQIAEHVGYKDHSSVILAIQRVENELQYEDIRKPLQDHCIKVAGIATIKQRKDELDQTITSLYNQVDYIHIYSNDYELTISDKKIRTFTGENIGDWGKFHKIPENCWYLSCDDDLIYPRGYARYMIKKSKEYQCPVSLHGRIFHTPITKYYKSGIKFRCLDTVSEDTRVNCIGTGTMCYFSDFKLWPYYNGFMADVWFSAHAQVEQIPLMVVEHRRGYLQYQQVKNTIYDRYKDNDQLQTDIVNKYLKEIL